METEDVNTHDPALEPAISWWSARKCDLCRKWHPAGSTCPTLPARSTTGTATTGPGPGPARS